MRYRRREIDDVRAKRFCHRSPLRRAERRNERRASAPPRRLDTRPRDNEASPRIPKFALRKASTFSSDRLAPIRTIKVSNLSFGRQACVAARRNAFAQTRVKVNSRVSRSDRIRPGYCAAATIVSCRVAIRTKREKTPLASCRNKLLSGPDCSGSAIGHWLGNASDHGQLVVDKRP